MNGAGCTTANATSRSLEFAKHCTGFRSHAPGSERVIQTQCHAGARYRTRASTPGRSDCGPAGEQGEKVLTSARSSSMLFARLSLLLSRMPMRASVWWRRASMASM